jgi:hypothetical protein
MKKKRLLEGKKPEKRGSKPSTSAGKPVSLPKGGSSTGRPKDQRK